jgi:3-methyladenine DNA glycosylase AlkD
MTKKSTRVKWVEKALRNRSSPARAKALQWFFKTGPGQYGEGDRFLGLTMPQIRALAKECSDLTHADIEALLESPWHESRSLAVVLLAYRYPRADAAMQRAIYALYLRRADRINNWDLVDISAPNVVGAHLLTRSRAPLHRLARSRDLWERRIAIVSTHELIRHGQFDDTLRLAVTLMHDEQDLIHKATGWMLREVGNRDEAVLRAFLDRRAGQLPRTALRYAIERLSPGLRRRYMAVPRAAVK